jgi:hypothetical protein
MRRSFSHDKGLSGKKKISGLGSLFAVGSPRPHRKEVLPPQDGAHQQHQQIGPSGASFSITSPTNGGAVSGAKESKEYRMPGTAAIAADNYFDLNSPSSGGADGGKEYRVVADQGVFVRQLVSLDSPVVKRLPVGSVMKVSEVSELPTGIVRLRLVGDDGVGIGWTR